MRTLIILCSNPISKTNQDTAAPSSTVGAVDDFFLSASSSHIQMRREGLSAILQTVLITATGLLSEDKSKRVPSADESGNANDKLRAIYLSKSLLVIIYIAITQLFIFSSGNGDCGSSLNNHEITKDDEAMSAISYHIDELTQWLTLNLATLSCSVGPGSLIELSDLSLTSAPLYDTCPSGLRVQFPIQTRTIINNIATHLLAIHNYYIAFNKSMKSSSLDNPFKPVTVKALELLLLAAPSLTELTSLTSFGSNARKTSRSPNNSPAVGVSPVDDVANQQNMNANLRLFAEYDVEDGDSDEDEI